MSAGHGPPIIYDTQTDRFIEIDGGGIPLGIFETVEYEEYIQPGLASGQIIIAATDGIWETKGQNGTLYGMERLPWSPHGRLPANSCRAAPPTHEKQQ